MADTDSDGRRRSTRLANRAKPNYNLNNRSSNTRRRGASSSTTSSNASVRVIGPVTSVPATPSDAQNDTSQATVVLDDSVQILTPSTIATPSSEDSSLSVEQLVSQFVTVARAAPRRLYPTSFVTSQAPDGPPPAQRPRIEPPVESLLGSRASQVQSSSEASSLGLSEEEFYAAVSEQLRVDQLKDDAVIAQRIQQFGDVLPTPPNGRLAADSSVSTSSPNLKLTSGVSTNTDERQACTICFAEVLVTPVACIKCKQVLGCMTCVKGWYDKAKTNNQTRSCPLCRNRWEGITFKKVIMNVHAGQLRL